MISGKITLYEPKPPVKVSYHNSYEETKSLYQEIEEQITDALTLGFTINSVVRRKLNPETGMGKIAWYNRSINSAYCNMTQSVNVLHIKWENLTESNWSPDELILEENYNETSKNIPVII